MVVGNQNLVQGTEVKVAGAKRAIKKSLIGPAQGWEGWVMRLFVIESEGCTPRHSHPWPHINYVVGGQGRLHMGGQEHPVDTGGYAFIPSGVEHQFANTGDEDLMVICIVPEEGDK